MIPSTDQIGIKLFCSCITICQAGSKLTGLPGCRDPSGTTLAFADMMKKQIVMPAHMMDDLVHKGRTGRNIFQDFSTVAESTGTYTAQVHQHSCLLPLYCVWCWCHIVALVLAADLTMPVQGFVHTYMLCTAPLLNQSGPM